MIGVLILWGHSLAALLFAAAALAAWRRPGEGWERAAFTGALSVTAFWALAVAGIEGHQLITRLAESARNLAWLGFTFALVRRTRAGGWALSAVYLVVVAVALGSAGLALAAAAARASDARELATAWLVFRMMTAAGALVLVRHLHAAASSPERGGLRLIAAGLGIVWSVDLLIAAAGYADSSWTPLLVVIRGFAAGAAALLLAAAAQRRDRWTLALSRPATLRALVAVALVVYLGLAMSLAGLAAKVGGDYARALQAGVVIGSATALLTILTTSSWGAWAKVKLAKHLFRHRYDYRTEWQRFTDTLGGAGAPLEERVVSAVATLLDAPAGLLLIQGGTGAAWRWDSAAEPMGDALADHLLATRRIVELDAARAGAAPEDRSVLPAWVMARADAWAIVPLIHGETLAGAVLLARPPLSRVLDWEDFDLLRVAGRQAASYLAEDLAGRALAEAQRFEEFNRRFAFILHDIKNLVSQQQLVARNAERHAANPEFRADMIATLKDSADRMTALLARLSQHEPSVAEVLAPVDCEALLMRVALVRRAQHPVVVQADAPCWAMAHPQRLEQALGHLLQNAVEASGSGAPVTVSVVLEGGRVAIDIADSGTGMTPAFVRDQLFRPFSSSKSGGFGIGAFEARQLIGGMGGTLDVQSREGEGTQFRVLLQPALALQVAA